MFHRMFHRMFCFQDVVGNLVRSDNYTVADIELRSGDGALLLGVTQRRAEMGDLFIIVSEHGEGECRGLAPI